jgi:hypothetical protein
MRCVAALCPPLPGMRRQNGTGPNRMLALISPLFPNPEMNKIMATVHWSGRNQITQPTYC